MERPDYFAMTESTEHNCWAGVYAVVFEGGTKFGRSKDVRNRIQHYRRPWCHEVLDVIALDLPVEVLVSIEDRAIHHGFHIAKLKRAKRDEFVPGLKWQGAVKAMRMALDDNADELARLDLISPLNPGLRAQKLMSLQS